jgi:hypothetical protein
MQEIVLEYTQTVTGSHLSREETIMSYVQHLLPKLRFQLPALSLNKENCDNLMSVILRAALPRMHTNRNTARSIIHGPLLLGGMALPHLDTVQGIDKLRLFLGHLRLQDDNGSLIKIDLTYDQLLCGVPQFVFNYNYEKFAWVEWGWVTSLWSFLSRTELMFHIPDLWLPTATREHDIFLMEYFMAQCLSIKELQVLNAFRQYLQVIMLSDITSADGTYIIPEAKAGLPIQLRTSSLQWPVQGRPNTQSWALWRRELSYLEERGKLSKPLGRHISSSHQTWESHFDPSTATLYLPQNDTYRAITPIVQPPQRVTRAAMRQ